MRFTALLVMSLVVTLRAGAAEAGCDKDGVMVFPVPGAVLPLNSRMILEGVGEEQARVEKLVGQELVLRAADDVVSVKVIKGWKSAVNRTAVVLKPNATLRANKTYSLMIDSHLPNYNLLNQGGADTLTWTAGAESDKKQPRYQLKPSIAEGLYTVDGDEVTRYLKITTTLAEDSPAYLVVTLRRARGSTGAQTYFVPLDGDKAMLGHDPCSGSFTFEDGRAYKATIEAYDSAGNAAPPLSAIEFNAPKRVR